MARAALVLTGAAVCGQAWVHTQQPSTRVASDLVVLNVTVTDAAGRFVPGLSAGEFHVTEDGRPQELTLFVHGDAPRSLLLLVDSSSSMDEEMSDVQQTLEAFVRQLPLQTSVELVDFDLRPKVLQPLTRDRDLVAAAVKRLRGGGSTSLYNALYITLRQMPVFPSGRPSEPLRTVVVLSDGDDTSSLVAFDTVLDMVRRSHTQIHAIGLHASDSGEAALRQLASETGGRYFISRRSADVRRSFAHIAQELAAQYGLGYVSSNRSPVDGWREVGVHVGRPELQIHSRPGYRAGTPRAGQ